VPVWSSTFSFYRIIQLFPHDYPFIFGIKKDRQESIYNEIQTLIVLNPLKVGPERLATKQLFLKVICKLVLINMNISDELK